MPRRPSNWRLRASGFAGAGVSRCKTHAHRLVQSRQASSNERVWFMVFLVDDGDESTKNCLAAAMFCQAG